MTREEIHRLIGGYATGTLSEAQRALLFEAALDDQELFDELARDQALKELLEAPGVKQRLLATIEAPPERVWWKHPLPWAMGVFALGVSAVLLAIVIYTPSGSRPVIVAKVQRPARPAPVTAESPGVAPAPPDLQNEPKQRTAEPSGQPAGQPSAQRAGRQAGPAAGQATQPGVGGGGAEAKAATETAPAQAPSGNLQNEPKQSQPGTGNNATSGNGASSNGNDASNGTQVADKRAPGVVGEVPNGAASVGSLTAPAPAAVPVPAGAPAPPVSAPQVAAPRAMGAVRVSPGPAQPLGPLAFDYSIYDGVLRIVPVADGYLLVRATVHDDDRVLLRSSHVKGSSPVQLSVPEGATILLISLSPRPVPEDSSENAETRVATRTDVSGHLVDPRPALTSRLEARIRLGGK